MKEIEIFDWGITVKIHQCLNAREMMDLQKKLSDALWEYRDKIGVERFRAEMKFDPEKRLDNGMKVL